MMTALSALLPYRDNEDRRSGWLGESHVLMVGLTDTPAKLTVCAPNQELQTQQDLGSAGTRPDFHLRQEN